MYADHSDFSAVAPAASCYFSIAVPASAHFSIETPSTSPLSDYSAHTSADPHNPLLAFRLGPSTPTEHMSSSGDASRLLQLQTAAAHRPAAEPLQQRGSVSSTSSSNSTSSASSTSSSSSSRSGSLMSPSIISCCRCRRESLVGMIQFGTNIHYCSHCARMTGYSAG
ncbi:hypothetical protein CC86DRAFT_67080 [Ophiobolus disseminans]|uniref:Uncharacterized protein n=1 Tax=Ophiobolus disseminans TaxID=1469910 RepID=A0A6A6ZRJ6_9PLEO|nr:hypothetical protein CC86DRAFT_67080 [Ophiobolus disseminans]